jgi:hypothetical protein
MRFTTAADAARSVAARRIKLNVPLIRAAP